MATSAVDRSGRPGQFGIFISYRRDDASGYAGHLHELLHSHFRGAALFMDMHTLTPGIDFVQAIASAIESADVMLVLIGPRWLERDASGRRRIDQAHDFVRRELRTALRMNVAIIPILIQGSRMPESSTLPRSLRAIAQRQAFELTESRWDYDTARLVEHLRVLEHRRQGGEDVSVADGSSLPVPMSTFVGRREELAELRRLITTTRLITLTGPGGTGKTRLAIELARTQVSRFEGKVHFVSLAAITDPVMVPSEIATELGLQQEPDRPVLSTLVDYIADGELLLILDNFEQVGTAAPLVAELLAKCPSVRLVVTSRSALRLTGEREFAVPPLALPPNAAELDEGALLATDAVALFLDRSRLVKRDTYDRDDLLAIANICKRLDGLPLAIELAAARAKLLPPPVMLERLNNHLPTLGSGPADVSDRHRTLEAAIDWSYQLLDDGERSTLRQLTIFAGGASLDAAEAVLDVQGASILDRLEALVNHSLIVASEIAGMPRFSMLQTIRDYAHGRLSATEVHEVTGRHATHFLALAEGAEPNLRGPEQDRWLAQLEAEHDNLRAVLDWALLPDSTGSTAAIGQRLTAILVRFWGIHGHLRDAGARLTRALDLGRGDDAVVFVRLLNGASLVALARGDARVAEHHAADALAIARELPDEASIAKSLINLGSAATRQGEFQKAVGALDEAVLMLRGTDDRALFAGALNNRGVLAHDLDELDVALKLHEEALVVRREIGDASGVASSLYNVGVVAIDAGDPDRGYTACAEALIVSQRIGDSEGVAYALEALAWVAGLVGDPERTSLLYAVASRVRTEIDAPVPESARPTHERYYTLARAMTNEDRWEAAAALGAEMELSEAIEYATGVNQQSEPHSQ